VGLRVADRLICTYDTKMVWDSELVQSGELLYIGTIQMTYQQALAIVSKYEGSIE
jgi:hypothetical protein